MPKTKPKILLIENDQFLYKILAVKLKRAGFDIFLAADGEEGIKKVKEVKPNLVLLDLILPKINGFAVLSEIKKIPGLKKIPVVILTNLCQKCDIEKGMKLGAKDYLFASNLSLSEIVEKVKNYFKI